MTLLAHWSVFGSNADTIRTRNDEVEVLAWVFLHF
jgi:hypothetical protein